VQIISFLITTFIKFLNRFVYFLSRRGYILKLRDEQMAEKQLVKVEDVTVRFAGDSGDGMQLTGLQFSTSSAIAGNDLNTLPDYPAEIRAPRRIFKWCFRISNPLLEWRKHNTRRSTGCARCYESCCT
jgi:hypothetical protein